MELGKGGAQFRAPTQAEIDAALPRLAKAMDSPKIQKILLADWGHAPWEKWAIMHRTLNGELLGVDYSLGEPHGMQTFHSRYPMLLYYFYKSMSGLSGVPQAQAAREASEELERSFVMWRYFRAGARDFHIQSDLALLLRDTDVPHMPSSELRFPFEALSLFFGENTVRDLGANMERFVLAVEGSVLHGFLFGGSTRDTPIFVMPLREGNFLDVRIDWYNGEIVKSDEGPNSQGRDDIVALLTNTLLYINSKGADVCRDTREIDAARRNIEEQSAEQAKKTRRQKQAEQQLRKAKSRYIYIVGGALEADEAAHVTAVGEEGRKIMKRFRVRGHWRDQPCGPERCRVERIWIKPHWKGPEMAELISKGYVVKRREE